MTIGGNGPVIEAGFAAAAAAFALDGALRAGVFRTTAALVPAWVRRPAGAAEDAGFGLLEALLPGVLRAAGAALVVLVNCRVAIE